MLISCDKNLIIHAILGSSPSLSGEYQMLHEQGLVDYYDQYDKMKWHKNKLKKLEIAALVCIYNLMHTNDITLIGKSETY